MGRGECGGVEVISWTKTSPSASRLFVSQGESSGGAGRGVFVAPSEGTPLLKCLPRCG